MSKREKSGANNLGLSLVELEALCIEASLYQASDPDAAAWVSSPTQIASSS